MRTSSIFNGRNDRNPLLPEDYNPNQDEDTDVTEPVKWKTVKSDMSKFVKSGGTYSSAKHIARQYVKAAGGARSLASQSYSGRKVGGNLGNFFNGIVTNGVKVTFKNLGIEYEGKSVEAIFSRLVDVIAPNSSTKEDIVAKEATQAALNNMSIELMHEALKEYVGAYIWITMMKDLGSRLEMYITNADDSYATECEFKDMIMGIVDVEFNKQGNIINKNISSTIRDMHECCLKVMEGIL